MKKYLLIFVAATVVVLGGLYFFLSRPDVARLPETALEGRVPQFTGPRSQTLPTVVIAKPVGWAAGAAPVAAKGLKVSRFAANLEHPRSMLRLPNGDILVAETNHPARTGGGIRNWVMAKLLREAGAGDPSPNKIILLRDTTGNGQADQRFTFLTGLNSPYGMALIGDTLYVANTDSLMAYPYTAGETSISAPGKKILNLPANAPNYHWTRSLVASPDGEKLYVGIGSDSNIAENGLDAEANRAIVLEVTLKTRAYKIFASGLRNPVGMAWNPWNDELWAVVNERDMLGSDLVPDYLTEVEWAGFYGWPWNYWGGYEDNRVQPERRDLREYTRRPDYGLGAHVAPLGLAFSTGAKLGPDFGHGAYIAEHGSWNRKPLAGYKVVYVKFDDKGTPLTKPIDLLTGFLNAKKQAQGRPVDVLVSSDGSLLVSDDVGGMIWRVSNPDVAKAAGSTEADPATGK